MHILVATGGSPHSQTALHLTGTLAAATGASVTLLTVAASEAHRASAETISLHASAALREWVAEVETRLSVGPAAASILSEANARNYDLLVIGERRGHKLIHRIVASTVERLTERAPCPVLVARSAGLPGRILICESSRRPLVVQRLVDKLSPIVDICRQATLLHVMSQIAAGPGVAGEDLRDDAEHHIQRGTPEGRLLREGLDVLAEAGVSAWPRLRHGRVVDEVVAESSNEAYDLIVIGAFRATGWDRMMLSDQARAILAGTHEPLLVL
jgi:nucleotide-binding universal stress UspA family protein